MFNASFLITYAEGLPEEEREAIYGELDQLAAAMTDVYVMGKVPTDVYGLAYQGDILYELGFKDQEAYEAAKELPEWKAVKELVQDAERVGVYDFAAYGGGYLYLTDTEKCRCHRLEFCHVRDGADPATVEHFCEIAPYMPEFVDGFYNARFSKTVESEGRTTWDYIFDCDFLDPSIYSGPYLADAFHPAYIDKYFVPICKEWCFGPELATSLIEVDGPFLANYAE